MSSFSLQTLFVARAPADDRALFTELRGLLLGAIAGRRAAPAAFVVRPERIDLIGFSQVNDLGWPIPVLLSALTQSVIDGSAGVIAVGVIGVFYPSTSGKEAPFGLLFLEWPDGRWVQWTAQIHPRSGELFPESERLRRALDGHAKPMGLGGWWSAGRRRPQQFELNSVVH